MILEVPIILPMKIYSRKQWFSRKTNPDGNQNPRAIKEIFIHWTESNSNQKNFADQAQAMRGLQSYHMDGNGWSDLGYHFVVFQSPKGKPWIKPRVFEGRKLNKIPAAQANHNTNTCAIAVVMNKDDRLKYSTKREIKKLVRYLETSAIGHACPVRPHKAVTSTDCPGPQLSKFVADSY